MKKTMNKTSTKQVKVTQSTAETEVIQEIEVLATEAFDAELKRKDYTSKAAKAKKVVDANVKKISGLYEVNGLTTPINLNRRRGDKAFNIQVGELPANASTTVLHEKLLADFKAGKFSDEDMLKVFSKLTKGAVDQLGETLASLYLKVNTDNKKFAMKVK